MYELLEALNAFCELCGPNRSPEIVCREMMVNFVIV
jgi:hypothetical protein